MTRIIDKILGKGDNAPIQPKDEADLLEEKLHEIDLKEKNNDTIMIQWGSHIGRIEQGKLRLYPAPQQDSFDEGDDLLPFTEAHPNKSEVIQKFYNQHKSEIAIGSGLFVAVALLVILFPLIFCNKKR